MITNADATPMLPAADPATTACEIPQRTSAVAAAGAGRVLVIDDDEVLLAVVGRSLRAAGFQVLVATSAEEGLDRFEALRPDCAIVDVYLPGLDGFAFVERAHAMAPDVPLLMLSGLEGVENERKAAIAGARSFLPKAIDVRDLARHVREAIATSAAHSDSTSPAVLGAAPKYELPLPTLDLSELERRAITEALLQSKGNRTQAARLLGIHVRTLHRKLRERDLAGETR